MSETFNALTGDVEGRLTDEQKAEAEAGRMAAHLTPGFVAMASAYRQVMRTMFGDGAEVNRNITKDVVAGAMMQASPYPALEADLLKMAYEEITKVTGTDEVWSFFETVGDLIP